MSRLARKIALAAEIEPTYGAGRPLVGDPPAPISWAEALWIRPNGRPNFRIERNNIPRELMTPFLGASDELIGPRVAEIEFEVELAASGTAGTPPAWGKLLRACQFAETITAGSRVEYTPVSDPGESLIIRYWADGMAYAMKGCRGTVIFVVNAFDRPALRFRFRGFDTFGEASGWSGPAQDTYTAWKTPLVPQSSNSSSMLLGCTYSNGNISGGTAYAGKGFELDMGHELTYDAILDGEKVVVTQRNPRGQMMLELTAAQEEQWRTDMNNSVETTFGWRIGTEGGSRITFFGRRLQRQETQQVDDNGFLRVQTNFGLILDANDPNDDFMRIALT